MERIRLIDPDMGSSTNAQANKFGMGKHGYKYGPPGTRTRVTKQVEDCQQEEMSLIVEEEGVPLEEDNYTQIAQVLNAKHVASAACNYFHMNSAQLATYYAAAPTLHGTLHVGSGGSSQWMHGNHEYWDAVTGGTGNLTDVVLLNGKHFACDDDGDLWMSDNDGASWNLIANPTGTILHLAVGGGAIMGVGLAGSVIRTTDAETITDCSIGGGDNFLAVHWDQYSSRFIAAQNGAKKVYTSPTGAVLTDRGSLVATPLNIASSHGYCHILTTTGDIARSDNGFTSFATFNTDLFGALFIAANAEGNCLVVYDNTQNVYISLNGVLFRKRPMNGVHKFPSVGLDTANCKVRYINGRFMLPGDNDQLMASETVWR